MLLLEPMLPGRTGGAVSARGEGSAQRVVAQGRTTSERGRRRLALSPRGQSLAEFAISFPVVMLMILFGIDFGRVFLGWVTLNNAVREAANFAAINPNAWTAPGSLSAQAEFERLINAEAAAINCALPATLPPPTFPNGNSVGSPAVVAITCEFTLFTPLVGLVVGNPLDVSSSAAFPIRSGAIAGTSGSGGPLPSIGPVLPSGSLGPAPSFSPIPTPSPVITPPPTCVVPDLVTGTGKTNQATQAWRARGFTANNLLFDPLVPPHYDIRDQSLPAGSSVLCTSAMTVYDSVQP